jgi:heme exporter protein D
VGGLDNATWQALGVTLSTVGLLLSIVVWRRRGPAAGLRGVAWSLLPAAAGLTGTLRLLGEIAGSVGSWAVRLVFSPVVWLGVALAGVSVVLFGVSSVMRNRGVGARRTRAGRPAIGRAGGSRPAVPPSGGEAGDDMDDIEAILRKHGIS